MTLKRINLYGAVAFVTVPLLVSGSFAQEGGSVSPDTMNVYNSEADGGEGAVQEMGLQEAAEACGVDSHFIEAWAQSEPRYCVAVSGASADGTSASDAAGNASEEGGDTTETSNEEADPSEAVRNIGAVVSAIQSGADAGVDLSGFDSNTTVTVLTLSSLEGPGEENEAAVESALDEHPDYLDSLRNAIQSNTAFEEELLSQLSGAGDNALDDVVAITTGASGAFTVYVDDTESDSE